jgi:hypothetical protein
MTTGNTTLLGLALPVDGELDGTWGDVVNASITSLVDSAVAGTTVLSTDADVTLTTTALEANQARQAIILWTASNGATTRNITAPAQSKAYIVINAGTGSIVLRGAGPTTGITVVSGERCVAAWTGSDFTKVATSVVDGVSTISFGTTGLTPSTTTSGAVTVAGTLAVANGGTGVTTSTGTGNAVLSNSPTLVTPALGTPSALVGTNITGTAAGLTAGSVTTNANLTGAVTSVGNATSLGSFTSAQLSGALTDETGSGSAVFATSPTLVTPVLGTPASATLTNATGLPISTGVSGLGTGVATFLATPSSANLAAAVTNETGSGALVFAESPTLSGTPLAPTASVGTNTTQIATTAYVISQIGAISAGVTSFSTGTTGLTPSAATSGAVTLAGTLAVANGGTGVTTATGTGAVVLSNSPTLVTPALGTPASGTLTNVTGLPLTTGVTGILPVANGGTATATPALVAGANVTITGTWPNQTIAAAAPGTGTVTAVTASAPLASSGGTTPNISVTGVLATANGGTGTSSTTFVNLATNVTGTLPTANGGTGNTNGTVAKLATTNFTVEESGGELLFKYGATTIASMDSAGVFTTLSDITANGTP